MMILFGCLAGILGITGIIWLVSSIPNRPKHKKFDLLLFVLGSVFLVQSIALSNLALHPRQEDSFIIAIAWGVGSIGCIGLVTTLVLWNRKLLNKISLVGFMAFFLLVILLVVWNFAGGPPFP